MLDSLLFLVPGIQMGPHNMHTEYMIDAHFNPVPMSVYSSALLLACALHDLDSTNIRFFG